MKVWSPAVGAAGRPQEKKQLGYLKRLHSNRGVVSGRAHVALRKTVAGKGNGKPWRGSGKLPSLQAASQPAVGSPLRNCSLRPKAPRKGNTHWTGFMWARDVRAPPWGGTWDTSPSPGSPGMPQSTLTPDPPCQRWVAPRSILPTGRQSPGQRSVFLSDTPIPKYIFTTETVYLIHLSSQEKQLRGAPIPAC